jgi:hypothetical protein
MPTNPNQQSAARREFEHNGVHTWASDCPACAYRDGALAALEKIEESGAWNPPYGNPHDQSVYQHGRRDMMERIRALRKEFEP